VVKKVSSNREGNSKEIEEDPRGLSKIMEKHGRAKKGEQISRRGTQATGRARSHVSLGIQKKKPSAGGNRLEGGEKVTAFFRTWREAWTSNEEIDRRNVEFR